MKTTVLDMHYVLHQGTDPSTSTAGDLACQTSLTLLEEEDVTI